MKGFEVEMSMRYFLLAALLMLACAASTTQAEPLNYDYIYLSSGRIEPEDGDSRNATAFGAFYTFSDNFHGFIGVDDGGAYAGNVPTDADIRNWRIGGGGHFFVNEKLIVAPTFALLRGKVKYEWMPGMYREYTDRGYALQLDARWNFADRWEMIGGLHHSDLFDQSETEIVAGILWHPTDWLALGAIAKNRETASLAELSGRWYF